MFFIFLSFVVSFCMLFLFLSRASSILIKIHFPFILYRVALLVLFTLSSAPLISPSSCILVNYATLKILVFVLSHRSIVKGPQREEGGMKMFLLAGIFHDKKKIPGVHVHLGFMFVALCRPSRIEVEFMFNDIVSERHVDLKCFDASPTPTPTPYKIKNIFDFSRSHISHASTRLGLVSHQYIEYMTFFGLSAFIVLFVWRCHIHSSHEKFC